MLDQPNIEAVDIQLQYCNQNKLRAWVIENSGDAAMEPHRIVSGLFAQGWAASTL